jgi:acyl-CoA reductase-like NAD-dependent aldehyde dehydrogenase
MLTMMHVDGEWTPSSSGATYQTHNPATGEVVSEVALGTREDISRALEAARRAAATLRRMTPFERASMCYRIADLIDERTTDIAARVTAEVGKPLREALGEVGAAAAGFRLAGDLGKYLEGSVLPVADPRKRVFSIRQPRGVYGVITPFNFPVNIPVEYLGPALATGNAVVWVPAPTTGSTAGLLMKCIADAGIPAGAVNLVLGEGPVVGGELVAHELTDAIAFTGGADTGDIIYRRAPGKPKLLEFGGNGPTIVFDDADLVAAAEGLANGAFFNAGQVCSSTGVVFAQADIVAELSGLLVDLANQQRLGDPSLDTTTMGPLHSATVAERIESDVKDAVKNGAEILTGGSRVDGLPTDAYFAPTVALCSDRSTTLVAKETFGPVIPIVSFESYDDAIAMQHELEQGLVASVWTKSMTTGIRAGEDLRVGLVNVNENTCYWELHLPFGGAPGKRSGVGRLGGKQTLLEMTEIKTITLNLEDM